MSIREAILRDLQSKQLLTSDDVRAIKTCMTGERSKFLERLTTIFEIKCQDYVSSCYPYVKTTLQLPSRSVKKIVISAYSAFYESNKCALIASLIHLLNKVSPDLLPPLGISNELSHDKITLIFVRFAARYQLFNLVNCNHLRELCTPEQTVFPQYLFNAFLLERQIKNPSQTECIYSCVKGIVYYLGTILNYSTLEQRIRETYFNHLETPQKQLNFAEAVATGYATEICLPHNQQTVTLGHTTVLQSEIHKICLPALTILGIEMNVDMNQVSAQLQEIQRQRDALQKTSAENQQKLNQARDEAHQKIDAWRKSVPPSDIRFGIQIGFQI